MSLFLLTWVSRPRVSDRFQVAPLLGKGIVAVYVKGLLFLIHDGRALGLAVGGSRPFPVRLYSSLVTSNEDE